MSSTEPGFGLEDDEKLTQKKTVFCEDCIYRKGTVCTKHPKPYTTFVKKLDYYESCFDINHDGHCNDFTSPKFCDNIIRFILIGLIVFLIFLFNALK